MLSRAMVIYCIIQSGGNAFQERWLSFLSMLVLPTIQSFVVSPYDYAVFWIQSGSNGFVKSKIGIIYGGGAQWMYI